MKNVLLDRVDQAELRTDLHFEETSSRPMKATLKVVKIDIFRKKREILKIL